MLSHHVGTGLLELGHPPQTRRRQALCKAGQVLFQARGTRLDDVCHPTRQLQPITLDRFGAEQGMADATQPHAYHQNHRQPQGNGKVGQVLQARQRYAPATGPLYQGEVGILLQHIAHRREQFWHSQRHPCLARRHMRGYSRLEGKRIDLLIGQLDRAFVDQRQGIAIAQAFRRHGAARGHRLGTQRAHALQTRRMQQAGGDGGLADIGIGTRNEKGLAHRAPLTPVACATHHRPLDRWLAAPRAGEMPHRPATGPAFAPGR